LTQNFFIGKLASWSSAILEMLTVTQLIRLLLVKTFYAVCRFIAVLTRTYHWALF
jgi:hypothetical protein